MSNTLHTDRRSGNITTIFKKDSKLDTGNYRPVSLTCISCKIIESLIRQSITDHLIVDNNVFSNKQFGFIKVDQMLCNCKCKCKCKYILTCKTS